ncbi:MAG: hypothetical protein GX040_12535 [Alcaligenaceae bacterium]|nr:hypothetical protein [Alcaligenaceae bacterium]
MFGSSKRAVFKPSVYESSSSRRGKRMPRWLVILFTGVIMGAGGFWFLQTNYGPKRLSVEESNSLTNEISVLTQEKQRLQAELEKTTLDLDALKKSNSAQGNTLQSSQERIQQLTADLELIKKAIPADPSGNPLGIRAAEFDSAMGKLDYKLLIMKSDDALPDYKAQLEFIVEGRYRNGKTGYAEIPPTDINITNFQQVGGSLTLPPTLTPRKVTIRVRSIDDQKTQANRTFNIR